MMHRVKCEIYVFDRINHDELMKISETFRVHKDLRIIDNFFLNKLRQFRSKIKLQKRNNIF